MAKTRLLERMVRDIKYILNPEDINEEERVMYLWDDKEGTVDYGKQYYMEDK